MDNSHIVRNIDRFRNNMRIIFNTQCILYNLPRQHDLWLLQKLRCEELCFECIEELENGRLTLRRVDIFRQAKPRIEAILNERCTCRHMQDKVQTMSRRELVALLAESNPRNSVDGWFVHRHAFRALEAMDAHAV